MAGWLGLGAWLLFTVGSLVITTMRHKVEPTLIVVVLTLGVLAVVNLQGVRLIPGRGQGGVARSSPGTLRRIVGA